MVDFKIVKELHDSLISGQADKQTFAAEHIRDLGVKEDYRKAFADAGVVAPLVGLLEGPMEQSTLVATEALTVLAQTPANRALIREAGGIANLVGVLRQSNELPAEVVEAQLQALSVLAAEEEAQQLTAASGGLPCIIRILGQPPSQECLLKATQLLGRVAHAEQSKDALREAGAVVALLKLLRPRSVDSTIAEAVCQALTILAVNNEINQDYIRDQYGIAPLVKLLEAMPATGVTLAAADAVRAVAMNNNENKTAVRENWGIPLLVKLLTEDGPAVEKAVDCLRILTTGNDANKVSLFSIPAAMPALVRLMQATDQVIAERAAAVVGNLSTREEFFLTMRESGALQRLVALLDTGPTSRITEIAAKTLANLAVADANRTGIRLAGGLPPLLRLLLERPTEQVQLAASEALKRMQVADVERNAILDTFRYMDAHIARVQAASAAQPSTAASPEQPDGVAQENGTSHSSIPKPFARYSVEETSSLLRDLGIRDTSAFEANGITGSDLLDLEEDDLRSELGLSKLQVKKVKMIQAAFETFSSMMKTQGRAELTTLELREWLQGMGRSEADAAAVITGFKEALGKRQMPELGFGDFARGYPWLLRTLSFMQQAAQHGFAMTQLPSFSSQPSGALSFSGEATPLQADSS